MVINMNDLWILSPILLTIVTGVLLLGWSFREQILSVKRTDGTKEGMAAAEAGETGETGKTGDTGAGETGLKLVHALAVGTLLAAGILTMWVAWSGDRSVTLFYLMKDIPVYFHIDEISRWFVTVVTAVWIPVGIYSTVYMRHEGEEKRFFGFYLLVYGVLVCLDFSGNLVTMYLFYEMMTLLSFPLVLHNGSREAIMAALKYLFYSMCGAYMGLFGIFFLYRYCDSLTFIPGGALSQEAMSTHGGILLLALFLMLIGFGAKAGMFPLHAWLPTAHPVAPSPASAALSGIIVKSGVLAIIRVVYYVVGADFLRGTWVQYTWMGLTLVTVFMGSLLAYREPVLKKRLAYSTVSQVSYILFGLAVLSPAGFTGALLHVVFHAIVKCGLFLTAGIFLFCGNKTKVEELAGMGRKMPAVLWCYTLFALALIGIPPTSGFVSKWYLAQGALEANIGIWGYVGPGVLLVSALLTAGYLLPITMKGFFLGTTETCSTPECVTDSVQDHDLASREKTSAPAKTNRQEKAGAATEIRRQEPVAAMLIPLVILAALALGMGLLPEIFTKYAGSIAALVL